MYLQPACYLPAIPVIEVDGNLLGVAPATADPATPEDRERYPVIWGALTHEAGHSAHSKVCPPPAERASWCQAAHLLEESRMEAAQITRRPGDRRWLRAAVSKLILGDFTAAAGAAPGTPARPARPPPWSWPARARASWTPPRPLR